MKKIQAAFLILFLAGCSSNQAKPPATTPGPPPIAGSLPTESIAPPTQISPPGSTPTLIFTSPRLWTPFPTFAPVEGMATLQIWLQGSYDCLLPCWGGITPGKTTWQEARQLLEQMAGFSTVNISENISCDFGICNGIAWSLYPQTLAEGTFYTKFPENTVHVININIQNEGTKKTNLLRNMGLQDVFRWYGAPRRLLFSATKDRQGQKFLELIMVYPERQFIIRYLKKAEQIDNKFVSCGQDIHIEVIILDNQEQLSSISAIDHAVETKDLNIVGRFKPVEEATGMTPHFFYVAYINSNATACISTPIYVWPP